MAQSITNPEEVLLLAADASRLMLESGGETYRAEETAEAVATALGGAEAACYATPTGLQLSFSGADGRVHSIVRRIKSRAMHLERIARLNALTRGLYAGSLDFDAAAAELERIERLPGWRRLVSIPATAAGTGFFTLFFGGAWNDALVAALIGAFLARMTRALARRRISDFFGNIAGGAVAAFMSILAARAGLASSADATILGVIMILVPGVAVTNAIRDTIAGDLVAGVARGVDAFMAAAAISIGAGGALGLWQALGVGPVAGTIGRSGLEVLWAALATIGFAFRFETRLRDMPFAAGGAALGWAAYRATESLAGSPTTALFAAALAVGLWAEATGGVLRRPASIYAICAIIPLVPGSGMYWTMLSSVRGDLDGSLLAGFTTLLAAGAIAAGLAVSSAVSRLISLGSLARRLAAGN